MDPVGFALENFDAVGQWRTEEYTEITVLKNIVKQTKLFPIDARGTMPDGTAFDLSLWFGKSASASQVIDFIYLPA